MWRALRRCTGADRFAGQLLVSARAATGCQAVTGARDNHAQAKKAIGLEHKVMAKLLENDHAISTVESATGGRIANLLTSVGGAAEVYWGSVITYDGGLRSDWGVPVRSVQEAGTVTEQVASEMAVAGLERMLSGYQRKKVCNDLKEPKVFVCLSTTGFAGGAPLPQDAGVCYLGLAMSTMTHPVVKKVHAPDDSSNRRSQHKEFFAQQSLKMIMEYLGK